VPHLLGALLIGLSQATDLEADLLRQAETNYRQGIKASGTSQPARPFFARAAAAYAELVRRGANNPELYTNLGQAYMLAGDLPRALLAYRHGLRLDPNDRVLQERLEEARDHVQYTTPGAFGRPAVDNWPPWLPRLTLRWQLIFVLALYVVACATVTRWWMTRQGAYLGIAGPAFTLAAFLGAGLFLEARQRACEKDHPAVVIAASETVLHKGNGANYPCYDAENRTWLETGGIIPSAATRLPPGAEARLRHDKGAWLQIELARGEIGWVRRADVVIDPPW
jgi:tetratricopeptide (TPR) repeat protein